MVTSKQLELVIKAQDKATKEMKKINESLGKMDKKTKATSNSMKSSMKSLAKGAAVAAVAIGAIAIKIGSDAVKANAEFDKSMANISTLIDTNVESMDDMKDAVLDLSGATSVPMEELTSSLYDIRSAGISAEDAISALDDAQQLSVAGLSSVKEATDIVTSSINAFSEQNLTSKQSADVFFKAVKSGKTTVTELAQGFGQVAPLASQVGVSFEDLMATVSSMTTSGLKASVAYTQVRTALSAMLKPTAEMQAAMEMAGITSDNLSERISEDGMTGVVRELSGAMNNNNETMAKAFGSVEALNAVMMLNGETGNQAIEIYNGMTDGTNALDEAYQKQMETSSAQYDQMKNKLNVVMIQLGEQILPTLIEYVGKLTVWIEENDEKIEEWIGYVGSIIKAMITAGKVIGGVVGALHLAFETMFLGVFLSMQKFMEMWNHMKSTVKAVADAVKGDFTAMKLLIVGDILRIKQAWNDLKSLLNEGIEATINIFKKTEESSSKKSAVGGSIMGGATHLVGERGPELFTPSTGGTITPANKTAQAMGGNTSTYNFNFAGATITDKAQLIQEIKNSLNREQELYQLGAL